ncbi:MAG: hypothetical protein FWE68_01680 [Defluviitaleaceae bacterium]|nr:hypothetical protein [Defluviitaleaceae bacterium]
MNNMEFSSAINQKLERYRAFFEHPEAGQLLITVPPYTFSAPPSDKPREAHESAWDPFKDAELMAERTVNALRQYTEMTKDVQCDYIPSVCPGYGIGLCSAFLSNAEVIPGLETSWVHPVLNDPDDMDKYRFDPMNPWVDFMRRYMKRAAELWQGDYSVDMLSAFAPSDLANAMRGNDFFYDLYDEPEKVSRMLSKCADALIALYRELRPYTVQPDNGFCAAGLWMPGEGFYMSEDAADLCSPEQYRNFFFPQTQRIINEIGGAFIHHHAKGWKIHAEISKLQNLRFTEFSWDPNCPRPVDHLDELLEMSLTTPLQIQCTLRDLKERAEQMRRGRLALMVYADSIEEAKEAVRIVRKYSVI